MKYYIDETNVEFRVGDVIEVPRWGHEYSTDFGVITEISETMWDIREQLNVYINGEGCYYKHTDIIALYRKDDEGNLILLWRDPFRCTPDDDYDETEEDLKRNNSVVDVWLKSEQRRS